MNGFCFSASNIAFPLHGTFYFLFFNDVNLLDQLCETGAFKQLRFRTVIVLSFISFFLILVINFLQKFEKMTACSMSALQKMKTHTQQA